MRGKGMDEFKEEGGVQPSPSVPCWSPYSRALACATFPYARRALATGRPVAAMKALFHRVVLRLRPPGTVVLGATPRGMWHACL